MEKGYQSYLNRLTDEIFTEAAKTWDWEVNSELVKWASVAQLHPMTIWNLGTRVTTSPNLRTVYKLARSVGWSIMFNKTIKLKKRVA